MLNYYIAYSIMTLSALWLNRGKKSLNIKNKHTYCIVFSIIWTILLGLRHPSMGVDLVATSEYGYIGQYNLIQTLSLKDAFLNSVQNYEHGYVIFCKLIGYISSDPQWLVFCCATVSMICVCLLISKNSELPFLSSIIYLGLPVFLITYSGLRQSLAISITLLSFDLIKRKKLFCFILTVLLAALFHSSAIIFLVAYPAYHIKLSKWMQIATMLILPTTFILRVPLFNLLSKILKDNAQVDNNGSITLFIIFSAIYIFIVMFNNYNDAEFNGLRNIYFLACFCQAFSAAFYNAMRVGYYFMIYLVILLPKLILDRYNSTETFESKRTGLIIYLLIFVCFFAYGLNSIANASWAMSNPHFFFWEV